MAKNQISPRDFVMQGSKDRAGMTALSRVDASGTRTSYGRSDDAPAQGALMMPAPLVVQAFQGASMREEISYAKQQCQAAGFSTIGRYEQPQPRDPRGMRPDFVTTHHGFGSPRHEPGRAHCQALSLG